MNRVLSLVLGSFVFGSVALAAPLHVPYASKDAFEVRRQVQPGGPVLGVLATELTPELQEFYGADGLGVLISRIIEDSAAEEAGLLVGDVLVAIDGEPIATIHELRGAVDAFAGRDVAVEVIRGGELIVVDAALADMTLPVAEPNFVELPEEALMVPNEELGRYVDLWIDRDIEQYRRAADDREVEFKRLERQFDALQEQLELEFEMIHDRLDSLEGEPMGRPEVR